MSERHLANKLLKGKKMDSELMAIIDDSKNSICNRLDKILKVLRAIEKKLSEEKGDDGKN